MKDYITRLLPGRHNEGLRDRIRTLIKDLSDDPEGAPEKIYAGISAIMSRVALTTWGFACLEKIRDRAVRESEERLERLEKQGKE